MCSPRMIKQGANPGAGATKADPSSYHFYRKKPNFANVGQQLARGNTSALDRRRETSRGSYYGWKTMDDTGTYYG